MLLSGANKPETATVAADVRVAAAPDRNRTVVGAAAPATAAIEAVRARRRAARVGYSLTSIINIKKLTKSW